MKLTQEQIAVAAIATVILILYLIEKYHTEKIKNFFLMNDYTYKNKTDEVVYPKFKLTKNLFELESYKKSLEEIRKDRDKIERLLGRQILNIEQDGKKIKIYFQV